MFEAGNRLSNVSTASSVFGFGTLDEDDNDDAGVQLSSAAPDSASHGVGLDNDNYISNFVDVDSDNESMSGFGI